MTARIEIDPELVRRYIFELAEFGKVGESGVTRLLYTQEWVAATNQYAEWCIESGLDVTRDAVGNVWGKLQGSTTEKSVASGSHIDSQRPGGRYDGHLGALGALIAVRSLREQFGQPRRSLEALAFCEEESSRFPNANFWGSRAITGRIQPEDLETVRDFEGAAIGDVMREYGYDPDLIPTARRNDIGDFIELHIEQGPILEQDDLPVAIVDAITGIRHYHCSLTGVQNHAGGFPMDIRNDPMAGFMEIGSGVINTAHRWGRPAVTTIGRVQASPNYPGVIPGEVKFSVDARHPDPAKRMELYRVHETMMREIANRRGLQVEWDVKIDHAPCLSDPQIVSTLRRVADEQEVRYRLMASGAAHDTQQMAAIARVAMIFVRSKGGRSHTPAEFSSIEDCVEGIRLLAAGMHALAY